MRVIVFDVNETLLDLSPVRDYFAESWGDARLAGSWFALLLQGSMVATLTETYYDFGDLAQDALRILARRQGRDVPASEIEEVLERMRSLPPHADVVAGLEALRDADFRLAALTNSPYRVLNHQLAHAGLRDFFDLTLSVDEVQRFKPHPAVYRLAAERLSVAIGDIRMVAAHNWDTTGAMRAGALAAFVARPGAALGDLDETPDIVGAELTEVAAQIIRVDKE